VDAASIDPALFESLVMRRALAARDVPTVYRMLTHAGSRSDASPS